MQIAATVLDVPGSAVIHRVRGRSLESSVTGNCHAECAPRGASSYPRRSREELGGMFLGQRLTWTRKREGTIACL